MTRVLVIGGSVAGTAFALLAARRGHPVTVLERDADAVPATVAEAWARWPRRTVPQLHQPHAFLAGLRTTLRAHWPDVYAALLAAGAEEFRIGSRDDEIAVGCRRSTLEWVLRRQLERTPEVRFESGTRVGRLCTVANAVVGVEAVNGRRFTADVVVDASGSRSRALGWARDAGLVVRQQEHSCEMVVYSRFYRVRADVDLPVLDAGNAESELTDHGACYAFRADDRVLSVSLAVLPQHPRWHELARTGGFEQAVSDTPFARLTAHARPITDVRVLGGFRNTLRHHSEQTTGLFAIGDALCTTNPAYGLGVPLALRQAASLVGLVGDPRAAEKWREHVITDVLPHWHAAVRQDAARIARWRTAIGLPAATTADDAIPAEPDLRTRHLLPPLQEATT